MSLDTIPQNLPVHPKAARYLHDVTLSDYSRNLKQCQNELNSTLDQIIETALFLGEDLPKDLLESLEATHDDLQDQYRQFKVIQNSLQDAKNKYRTDSDKYERIADLNDWQKYTDSENASNGPKSLLSYYKETLDKNQSSTTTTTTTETARLDEKNKTTTLFKILPQIWNNPTAVIKDDKQNDDNDEEDEIQIEGGTIELICPITCKPFEIPMISKKCGHTFDKQGIITYLGGPSSRASKDCPQTGCSKSVSINNFEIDEVMKLRCKIARSMKRKQKANSESDSIDVI